MYAKVSELVIYIVGKLLLQWLLKCAKVKNCILIHGDKTAVLYQSKC